MNASDPSVFAERVGFRAQVCQPHREAIIAIIDRILEITDRTRLMSRLGFSPSFIDSNDFASNLNLFCPNEFGTMDVRRKIILIRIRTEQLHFSETHVTPTTTGPTPTSRLSRFPQQARSRIPIRTSREKALDEAGYLFVGMGRRLLLGVHIEFLGELGEDIGGVTRDWFTEIANQAMSKLFVSNEDGFQVIPAPSIEDQSLTPVEVNPGYLTFGRIIALSIIEGYPLGLVFPHKYISFITRLDPLLLEEMQFEEPIMYNSLNYWIDHLDEFGGEMEIYDEDDSVETAEMKLELLTLRVQNREEAVNIATRKMNEIDEKIYYRLREIRDGFQSVFPREILGGNIMSVCRNEGRNIRRARRY